MLTACGFERAPSSDIGAVKQPLVEYTLEANQALGVLSAQRLVAGKSTVLLAYLKEAIVPNEMTQKIVVSRNGTEAFTLTPQASETAVKTLVFACKDPEACGKWAAGTYSFVATIEGVSVTLSGTFVKKRALRALAVPVTVKYGAEVKTPDDKWKKHGEFLRSVWPVADDDFSWSLREGLDLSQHDVLTDDGQRAVWQALANLNPDVCSTNPGATGCFDAIMGFIKARPGDTQGYTFGLPAVVNVNDDEDAMATVAHEFGHTGPFKLGDEYKGGAYHCEVNPTPPSYVGKNFNDSSQMMYSCTASTEVAYDMGGRAGAGSAVSPASHAYDMSRGLFTTDTLSFMGSGSPQAEVWVTPRAYERAFDQATPYAATPGDPPGPVVELEGWLKKDGTGTITAVKGPWTTYTGVLPTVPAMHSEYTVRAYDIANNELTFTNLEVDFYGRDPFRALSQVALDGTIAFLPATARFDVMKGNMILLSVPVSANAPVVVVTAPAGGGPFTGNQTISWTGTDADPRTTLSYTVEYCENATTLCDVVATELTTTSTVTSFDDLAGAAAGFIRVTATDGLRTTSADGPALSVPFKAPVIEIYEPDQGDTFDFGKEIVFDAVVFDEQDSAITAKAQLKWKSDVALEIGAGTRLTIAKIDADKCT